MLIFKLDFLGFFYFPPKNLSKSEPMYAYKRYAYKKNVYKPCNACQNSSIVG